MKQLRRQGFSTKEIESLATHEAGGDGPESNDSGEAHGEGAKVDGRIEQRDEDIGAAAPGKDEDSRGGGGTERKEGNPEVDVRTEDPQGRTERKGGNPEVDVRTEDPQGREHGGGGDGKLR